MKIVWVHQQNETTNVLSVQMQIEFPIRNGTDFQIATQSKHNNKNVL